MGVCSNFKALEQACFNNNECGRYGACLFNNPNSISGICTKYMSIDSGSATNVMMRINSYSVVNDDSHLLCLSQYSNASGVCSEGAVSTYKGQYCNSSNDCNGTQG